MPRTPSKADAFAGARLRDARQLAGMSQTELAERVNVSFQQIQKYEKGANRISASRLQEFAQILNVPPAYFFHDPLARESDATDILLMGDEPLNLSRRMVHELVHHFMRIPSPSMRQSIAQLVKACAEMCGEEKVDAA